MKFGDILELHGLNLFDDIVAITTDVAAVMQKIRIFLPNCKQQIGYARAVQLAVIDALCKNSSVVSNEEKDNEMLNSE